MEQKNKLDPFFDIDTYINRLEKTIESQKYFIESLKNEIKTQRKEIAGLREEQKMFLNLDKPPIIDNYNLWKEKESNDIQ
jgi:hypothetical protein